MSMYQLPLLLLALSRLYHFNCLSVGNKQSLCPLMWGQKRKVRGTSKKIRPALSAGIVPPTCKLLPTPLVKGRNSGIPWLYYTLVVIKFYPLPCFQCTTAATKLFIYSRTMSLDYVRDQISFHARGIKIPCKPNTQNKHLLIVSVIPLCLGMV